MIFLQGITEKELIDMVRDVVRKEIRDHNDRLITKKEVQDIFGCSMGTVNNMIRKGVIQRINPGSTHPRFLLSEILKIKKI